MRAGVKSVVRQSKGLLKLADAGMQDGWAHADRK